MTWEQRMSEAAKARRVAAEAESAPRRAAERAQHELEAAACNEAAIRDTIARITPDEARDDTSYACACAGGPAGCSMCFCHIFEEARARINGRACRWFGGHR